MLVYLLVSILAFVLGMSASRIVAIWERLAESVTPDLPATTLYSLVGHVNPDTSWIIAGEYLVRDNGVTRNVYLTRYARWLMGEFADVVLLTPFKYRTAYVDTTPTGGKYIRMRKEVAYRAFVVSYDFPQGQGTWSCVDTTGEYVRASRKVYVNA